MKPSLPIQSSRKTMRKPPKYTPVPVSLTVSLMVMLQGRCARHSCVCAFPFPEMAATSCGMPVDIKNAAHLNMSSSTFKGTRVRKSHHESKCFWFFTGNTAPFVVHFTKGVSLNMRPSLINRLSSFKAFLCDTTASCGGRPSFTNWTSSLKAFPCDSCWACFAGPLVSRPPSPQ